MAAQRSPAQLSPVARDFFLTAEDLASRQRPAAANGVAAAMTSYFGSHVGDPTGLVEACRRARLLRRGARDCLLPTRRGRRYLETAVEEYYLERGLVESTESPAFRELSLARQGLEVVQHGSLTRSQLEAIIDYARALNPARILDLGCGAGEPGTLIAAHTDARLLGVDRSASAVTRAEESGRDGTAFIRADMQAYASGAPRGSPDVVLAIDALYWVDDPDSFLRDIFEILTPGGCFMCISSEFEEKRSRGETLPPQDTEVGAALEALAEERGDLRVETRDFTDEERSLWLESLELGEEWEEAFSAEGRAYLLRNIVREAEYLEQAMRQGRGARYLFAVYRAGAAPMSVR